RRPNRLRCVEQHALKIGKPPEKWNEETAIAAADAGERARGETIAGFHERIRLGEILLGQVALKQRALLGIGVAPVRDRHIVDIWKGRLSRLQTMHQLEPGQPILVDYHQRLLAEVRIRPRRQTMARGCESEVPVWTLLANAEACQ